MSLTKNDIQMIVNGLKPTFDAIDKRFQEQDECIMKGFRKIIEEVYDLHPSRDEFAEHEKRLGRVEQWVDAT